MPFLLDHLGYIKLADDDTEQYSSDEFGRADYITKFKFDCDGTPATAYVLRNHDTDEYEILFPMGVPQNLSEAYRALQDVMSTQPMLSRRNVDGRSTLKAGLGETAIERSRKSLESPIFLHIACENGSPPP